MSNFLANLFSDVAKALGKVQGLDAIAMQDLSLVQGGVLDYEAGKPVVLGPVSEDGKAGYVVALMKGGASSILLGLD